jgi:hypothetical protein
MEWRSVRHVVSSIFLLIACSNQAQATIFQGLQFKPYVGWEYQYQHIKGNETWSEFMPANFSSQAFLLGTRYHPNFGLEVSYYHTFRKAQSSAYISSFNGTVDPSGTTLAVGQMRNEGFSFDWDLYFPLDPKFNFMGTIALVTYHPNMVIYTSGGTNLAAILGSVTPKNQVALRLGVGLEYEERHWGARARVLWDQTQTIYVNLNNSNAATYGVQNDPFKQAVTVTGGIFYIF